MKLYRYCSAWEYENFIAGRGFVNERPAVRHYSPTPGLSVSFPVFWFFPVEKMTIEEIKNNLHQLSGIVVAERLMVLDFDDEYFKKYFQTRLGRYIARGVPDDDFSLTKIEMRDEYYVKYYSKHVAKLLDAYSIDFDAFMRGKPNEEVFKKLEVR